MVTQAATKNTGDSSTKNTVPGAERIARLRNKYQTGPAFISVERGQFYTDSWQATEGKGHSPAVRVALAMKNVYQNMTHYLDPDDHIAGYWCEYFCGMPVDVERGVFNAVLEAELDKKAMLKFRAGTAVKGMSYMLRKRMLGEFIKNQKIAREAGASALNMDLKTMGERTINPYQIKDDDKKLLLKKLLPYWSGKSTVDHVEKELMDSGLLSQEMYDFLMAIPGNTSKQVFMLTTCASIASYHAHIILDYGPVLGKGLLAMKRQLTDQIETDDSLTAEQKDFLKSVEIATEGVIIYARRLAEHIEAEIPNVNDPERKARYERMLAICKKVPLHPPETFEEAVQAMWTVKTAVEVAHPVYLHCFGRIDQQLFPYYKKDLEQGRITDERVVELLSELLLKIMSQNIRPESNILSNFYHRFLGSSPVTLAILRMP